MEFNPIDIVQHILNIIVLYIMVRSLLYKPVRQFMLQREESIREQIAKANETAQEASDMRDEYQRSLDNAATATRDIMMKGAQQADRAAKDIREKAKQEALEIVDQAYVQVGQLQKESIRELKTEVTDMSVELAERILKHEVKPEDNREIIDSFFRERCPE